MSACGKVLASLSRAASPLSALRPTITTVEIDGARIAREVLAAIRAHSAGEELPQRSVDVGFRLIARESA